MEFPTIPEPSMKIALIGISGRAGSRIADELLRRDHQVTGIARNTAEAAPAPGARLGPGDAAAPAGPAPLLAGHLAVVSAAGLVATDARQLLPAVRSAGVSRLLVVGGAGSLRVAPGLMLIDTPDFPDAYRPE